MVCEARKNKANSKPNLFSPQTSLGVEKTKPIRQEGIAGQVLKWEM
jgi:hypothetical protein